MSRPTADSAAIFAFPVPIVIRFSDVDMFGHVNHARYLTFCEDHRTSFFAAMALSTGSDLFGTGFAVAKLECEYKAPLTLHSQDVYVSCCVISLGRSSIRMRYRIREGERTVALIATVLVVTDPEGRSRSLTGIERDFLGKYVNLSRHSGQSRESGRPGDSP